MRMQGLNRSSRITCRQKPKWSNRLYPLGNRITDAGVRSHISPGRVHKWQAAVGTCRAWPKSHAERAGNIDKHRASWRGFPDASCDEFRKPVARCSTKGASEHRRRCLLRCGRYRRGRAAGPRLEIVNWPWLFADVVIERFLRRFRGTSKRPMRAVLRPTPRR